MTSNNNKAANDLQIQAPSRGHVISADERVALMKKLRESLASEKKKGSQAKNKIEYASGPGRQALLIGGDFELSKDKKSEFYRGRVIILIPPEDGTSFSIECKIPDPASTQKKNPPSKSIGITMHNLSKIDFMCFKNSDKSRTSQPCLVELFKISASVYGENDEKARIQQLVWAKGERTQAEREEIDDILRNSLSIKVGRINVISNDTITLARVLLDITKPVSTTMINITDIVKYEDDMKKLDALLDCEIITTKERNKQAYKLQTEGDMSIINSSVVVAKPEIDDMFKKIESVGMYARIDNSENIEDFTKETQTDPEPQLKLSYKYICEQIVRSGDDGDNNPAKLMKCFLLFTVWADQLKVFKTNNLDLWSKYLGYWVRAFVDYVIFALPDKKRDSECMNNGDTKSLPFEEFSGDIYRFCHLTTCCYLPCFYQAIVKYGVTPSVNGYLEYYKSIGQSVSSDNIPANTNEPILNLEEANIEYSSLEALLKSPNRKLYVILCIKAGALYLTEQDIENFSKMKPEIIDALLYDTEFKTNIYKDKMIGHIKDPATDAFTETIYSYKEDVAIRMPYDHFLTIRTVARNESLLPITFLLKTDISDDNEKKVVDIIESAFGMGKKKLPATGLLRIDNNPHNPSHEGSPKKSPVTLNQASHNRGKRPLPIQNADEPLSRGHREKRKKISKTANNE